MEIKSYAPIAIPTLNRFEHFRRCLESLERCTGADRTEVFVGLDYPPSKKYAEGWKKIDAYLAEKEQSHGFKNLYVRRRLQNCGVCKKGSNMQLLTKEIREKSDRYITSEDDNEFSPNFLEYMNKALEMYKDEDRVIKVSAYTPPLFSNLTDNSTFFSIDTPAYGIGSWSEKNAKILRCEGVEKELTSSFKRLWCLFWTYPALIYMAVHMVVAKRTYGDIRYAMNNLLLGTFTLMPSQSLVRNWGTDGSGLHSGVVKGLEKEEIQTAAHFKITSIPFEYPVALKKKLRYRSMPQNKVKYYIYFTYKLFYVLKFYFGHKWFNFR